MVTAGHIEALSADVTRYVGVPSMSALPKHLASSLQVTQGVRAMALTPVANQWHLLSEAGTELGHFDAVIVAIPPSQAAPLLSELPGLLARVNSVELDPCWAALVTLERVLNLPIDAAFVHDADLGWIARNASKPGRPPGESWVLHATPAWSTRHLDDPPASVAEALLAAFFASTGAMPVKPLHLESHRWRYAKALQPLTQGCLWDASARVAVCGRLVSRRAR